MTENKRDWRLRNTALLLRHYRRLKSHCEGIVPQLEAYTEITYDDTELELHSLMISKAKTKQMLDFIDLMLSNYKGFCAKSGEAVNRRYLVIQRLYLIPEPLSKEEVAESLYVDSRTIRRDEKRAVEELSAYFFGVDSLLDLE